MNNALNVPNMAVTAIETTLAYTPMGASIAGVAAITSMLILYQQLSALNEVPPIHLPFFFLVTLILTSLPWLVSGWGSMLLRNMM